MRVGGGFDQLHVDANLIARFLHASFQDVGNAELLGDLGEVARLL